jgi:hypothetical protein
MFFKVFKNFKIKALFVIFLILSFLNIYLIPVYAHIYSDGDGSNGQSFFNPLDYEIDSSKKHELKKWKHEGGPVFSINFRLFYDIQGIKMVPCKSYQEWSNGKQLTEDVLGFIPGAGHVFNFAYDVAEVAGFTDRLIDANDYKIAMLNDIVYYELESDPGKGFFFFNSNELEKIKQIDFAFCDCDKHVFVINEILESFIKNKDLDKTYMDPEKDIELSCQRFSDQQVKKIVLKINQKVRDKIHKNALKKVSKQAAKKTVGHFLGKIFVPGLITVYEKAEQIQESDNSLKQRITFDITNNSSEKTIGFAFNFPSENEIEIYELKEKYNHEKTFRLAKRSNISNSDHMLVNVLKAKTIDSSTQTLNICGGRLKRGFNL